MIPRVACLLILLCCASSAAEEKWRVTAYGMQVAFCAWQATPAKPSNGVLVLVPGYNGDGATMLDARWKAFAAANDLLLLAPTFHAAGDENNHGRGYYYPKQGSGAVMEQALAELHQRFGVDTQKVFLFGFSAGAHFSHRFALWRPARVKAFVAVSAAWWSEPTAALRTVPALILCGEDDPRYAATFGFFKNGHALGCPWLWRSYEATDHELTPSVRAMAEAFLHHYATAKTAQAATHYGDLQTFRSVPAAAKETISPEFRLALPTTALAKIWEKEQINP